MTLIYTFNFRSHPCGEAYLYFYSSELGDLLEGLHEAVSNLINKNCGDDTSVLSDLSELSGALSSVVVLPQRMQDSNNQSKIRKSTSFLDISELNGSHSSIAPRLSSSQSNLSGDGKNNDNNTRLFGHFRRKSMSETNLTKLCLDETDEELDSRDDDLEDLRHMDVPKDRTSSSGSYNSYRSNDSGVKLSASPSNYGDSTRIMIEYASIKFVSKSDSLDSGVRTCVREDNVKHNQDELRRAENLEEFTRKVKGTLGDEPDLETKVGTWCLQSARARKSLLSKNLAYGHKDFKKSLTLSRTLSES